jgi:Chaperone of endosialidase
VTITSVSTPITGAQGGTGLSSYTANAVVYAPTTSTLATSSALTFDGTNLGIGTSSVSQLLDVRSGSSPTIKIRNTALGSGNISQLLFEGTNNFSGTSTSFIQSIALVSGNSNTALVFGTNAAGGGAATENMRLDSSGNLLVGSTSPNGKIYVENSVQTNTIKGYDTNASTTSDGIFVAVALRNTTNNTFYAFSYYNAGAGAYKFRVADSGNVTNTNNSYGAISDVKLKENIVDASPKLADLMQVKVRNYNLKSDPTHKQLGVIAQELETVFPSMVDEAIDTDEEGNVLETTTKSVKYSVFVPMLIKAIQELSTQLTELKAEVATLRGA